MMAAVFENQGFGQFAAALVSFICAVRFKESLSSSKCEGDCIVALDKAWRIVYGLGILPAIFALYFRFTIPETVRFTLDVTQNEEVGATNAMFMEMTTEISNKNL